MGVKQAIKILNQRKEEEQQQRQIAPIKTENPRGAIANEFKNFMMQTANDINNTTRNSIEALKNRQNQTTEQDNKRLIAPVGNIENKMQNKYAGLTGKPIAPTKNDITLSENDIKELAKKYNKTDIVTNQKTAESLQKAIEEKEQKEKIQRTEDTPIYDTGTKVKRNRKGEWEIKDKVFKEPEAMTDLKDRIKKSGIDGLTFDEFKDNVVDAFDTTKYILEDSAAHGLGNVFKGIAGVGEGIDDAGHYGFAQLVKLAGNIGNNQELKDWADEIEYDTSKTGKWLQWLEEKTNDAKADSVFGNKSERVAEGVGSTIPTMVVDLLTTGGTGTIAKIGKTAGLGLMGMSSAGSSLSESYQTRGKLDGLAWIKAGIDGGTSIFVEQSGGMLGNGLSYDTKIANELTKNLKPSFKNSVISIGTRLGLSSIAEGNEEVIEAVANATTSKFANGFLDLIGDKGERYDSNLSIQEIVDNFTYGTIASLITQGGAKITQIGGNAVVNNETFNESVKQLAKAEDISGQLEEKEAVLDKYEKELNKSKTSEERTKIEEKIEKTKQEIELLQANETEKDIKELLNERIDNNKIEQARESRMLAPVFKTEQQNNALNIPQVEQTTRATAEAYKNAFKSDEDRERIVTQLEAIQNTRNKYNKNGTLNIVFDSTINGNGVLISDKQGNRTIKLNPKTDKAAEFVLIHELTHDLKGSDAFTELSELVQSFNNKQFNFEDALESIKNTYEEFYKRNNLDMSDLDTKEEAMADVLGTALGNQEFVNQLTQKPTLFQKIKNWISKQIAIHKSSDKEFTRWLYNVQGVFKNAVRSQNNVQEGYKYHVSENLSKDIDLVLSGKSDVNNDIKIRDFTPKLLVNVGIKDLPMLMNQNHIKENILSATKARKIGIYNKDANYHGLGKDLFIKAIDSLDNPIAIMKSISKNGKNSYVVVTDVKNNNNEQIIVPIYIEGKGNYNNIRIDTNKVKSVYGKKDIKQLVDNTIKGNINNIIYLTKDKNKRQLITRTGLQLSNRSNTVYNNSIPPTEAEVNTTNSNSTQESKKYSVNSELEKSSSLNLPKNENILINTKGKKINISNLQETAQMKRNTYNRKYDKNSITAYRGISENTGSNSAMYGLGLYTTLDKKYASKFGNVEIVDSNLLPNNPLHFKNQNDFQMWKQDLASQLGVRYSELDGENFGIEKYVTKLGYDGLTIGTGKSTDIVTFETDSIKKYSQSGNNKWKEYLDFIDKKVTETKGKQEKTYFNKQLAPVKEIIQETNSAMKELKEEIGEIKKNIAPIDNDKSLDSLVDELDKQERILTPITGKTSHAETLQEQFESLTNSKIRTERKKKKSFKDVKSEVKQTSKNLYQALVNKMQPIEDLAKKSGNKELKFTAQKTLTASGQGQYNIGVAQTDINGRTIGKSVNDIFQQVIDNGKLELASEYLNLLDNSTRAERGRPIYAELNAQQSKKLAADILKENPEFKQLQKEVEKYQDNELKMLVDAGFISKADAKYIKNQNPYHVPIERIVDEKLLAPTKTITSGKGIKKARGGNSDILSSNEAIANRSMKLRRKIVLNELITEMAKAKGKYQEIANPSTQYKTEMLTDTNISEENLHFVLDGEMDVDTVFDQENDSIRISEDGKYKAVYFEDGIGYEFDITKGEYDALKQHEANAVEEFATKTLGKVSQFHKDMLTKYSLTFTAKNALKDIQDVAINTTSLTGFIKAYPKAIKQIGTDGELWNLYLANGGGNLSYFDYNTGVQATKTKNPVKIVGRAIGDVNEIVEQLPRFTEFISTLDRGGSINEAMYNAADITTNFARGGEITKALNRSGATFLNASVQGFDKFIRNFSMQNGVRPFVATLAKAAAFGMAPALLNALIYGDDEDYDRLPDSDKDLYYLFKNDSGTFIRIPKGRTLSVFGTAARRTLNYAKGDKEAFNGMLETVSNQVAPNNPITDNVIAPIIGAATNKNWYGGKIVSDKLQEQLPKNQYDESTDDLSIAIGKKIGVSPKKINYVIDQYSGGVGDILLPVMTKKASNKGNVFKDQFTTDPVLKNRYVSKFYDTVDKITQITNDEASTEDDKLKLMYLDKVKSDVGDLYNQKREIQNSDLSNKEKSKQVREVQKQINDKVEDALDNYEKINKSTENIARIKDSTYVRLKGEWKSISDSDTEKIEKVEKSGASADDYLKYKIATYHTSDEDIDSKEKNLEKLNYIKNVPNDKIRTALYENTIGESDNNFRDYKGSSRAYIQYKIDTKEATEGNKNLKQNEKIDILLNNGYRDSDIQKIYENQIKSDEDLIYDSLKDTIDIKEYLKYKQQDFSSDKLDDGTLNGKTVSGSSQKKVYNYINSMNISREEKLILIGSKYKLTNTERTELAQYINTLSLSKKNKLELYSKMKGFTVYKDGRVTW